MFIAMKSNARHQIIHSALKKSYTLHRFYDNNTILPQFIVNVWQLIETSLAKLCQSSSHKASFTIRFQAQRYVENAPQIHTFYIGKRAQNVGTITMQDILEHFDEKFNKFTNNTSNFIIVKYEYLEMRVVQCESIPLNVGHGQIKLPPKLFNKKAVINVTNNDSKCFIYAILSVLFYD